MTDDSDNKITLLESTALGRFFNPPQRFVPQNELVASRRRPSIVGGNQLKIGAADTKSERVNQNTSVA